MKSIYRINTVEGQSNLICVEADMKDIQQYINENKWIKIDDNTSLLTNKIVTIECIARVHEDGASSILRLDEYTLNQLNRYLKNVLKINLGPSMPHTGVRV